jgi:hypothetical protein
MRSFSRNLVWLAVVAGAVWGCSGGEPSAAAKQAMQAAAAKKKAANPQEERLRNMVSAVPANKAGTVPLQVKFEVRGRPDLGQPVDVDLMIVPLTGTTDRVSGKVEADDGLEVVDGAQIPPADRPVQGVPIEHLIKVLPKRDGIFTFSATLTVESGGLSSSETFSMPLIAGAGQTDLPAKPPAKTAATQ